MLKSDTPASLACVVEYSLLSGYSRPSATKHVRERGRGVVTGEGCLCVGDPWRGISEAEGGLIKAVRTRAFSRLALTVSFLLTFVL